MIESFYLKRSHYTTLAHSDTSAPPEIFEYEPTRIVVPQIYGVL